MVAPFAVDGNGTLTFALPNAPKAGTRMPAVGLGTWKSPENKTKEAVIHAIKSGFRSLDTANDYGNEKEVGEAVKYCIDSGICKREDLFIQSKLWNTNHRREHVEGDLRATLEDLQLDYVDSYVIHWPQACPASGKQISICREPTFNKPGLYSKAPTTMFPMDDKGFYLSDNECHYMETWEAMEDLVDQGLTKTIGVSNFSIAQLREVIEGCKKYKPVVIQNEIHPYLQGKDMLDYCNSVGVLLQGYSPLASGDGPFRKPGDPTLFGEPVLSKIADKYNVGVAQVVIRWHVQRGLSVVPKSVTPKYIEQNIDIQGFTLSDEEMKEFDAFNKGWKHCSWPETSMHPDYPFKDSLPHNYKPTSALELKTSGKDY